MTFRSASSHGGIAARTFALAWMVAVSFLLLMATGGHAQTGEQDFLKYCATCHGATGKGGTGLMDGVRPPDLTLLARKNHGRFPFAEVYEVVAGQRETAWHRRRAGMAYWSDVFYDEATGSPDQRKAEVKERLLNIVRYLQQIQRK